MKNIKIKFIDYDDKVISEQLLNKGDKVKIHKPKRYFYTFTGWNPILEKTATKNIIYKATYKPKTDYDNNGISDEEEFLDIVKDILNDKEFLKRKNYRHHGDTSVYEHCFAVSYYSYLMAKKLHLNYRNAAIAGLLHDFYYKDWTTLPDAPLLKKHGFVHAREALENSKKEFPHLMNKHIENAIVRHMFPLNIIPPKCSEGWIVTTADKYVSMDVLKDYKILLSFFFKKYQKRK